MRAVAWTCVAMFAAGCVVTADDRPGEGPTDGVRGVDAPTLVVLAAPADGGVLSEGEPLVVAASVEDDAAPDRLEVALLVDQRVVWQGRPTAAGAILATASDLDPGPHVWVLTVLDPDGLTTSERRTVRVNNPPRLPVVELSPAAPRTGDALRVVLPESATDPDGDPLEHVVTWWRNGVLAVEGARVPADVVTRGERWWVQVVVTDSFGAERRVRSDEVEVANAPPELLSAVLVSDGLHADGEVTVEVEAVDPEGDPILVSTLWSVDGLAVSTEASLRLSGVHGGQRVTVDVSPRDALDAGPTWVLSTVVAASPPRDVVVRLLPEAPVTGDTLHVDATAVVPDGGDVSWIHEWFLDGVSVQVGASDTWASVRGHRMRVVSTARLDSGLEASGEAEVVVGNAPPVVSWVVINGVYDGEVLLASCRSGATDPEYEDVSTSVVWRIGGVVAPELVGDRVPWPVSGPATTLQCEVTPHDGQVAGLPLLSNEVRAGDTPPEFTVLPWLPATAVPGQTLGVNPGSWVDADGDTVTAVVTWFLDGEPWRSGEQVYVPYGVGAEIQAQVELSSYFSTTVAWSPIAVVGNAPPRAGPMRLEPALPTRVDALRVRWSPSDPDGRVVDVRFTWLADGVEVQSGPDDTLLAPVVVGQALWVRALATDDNGATLEAVSPTVHVRDDPPDLEVELPMRLDAGSPLVCEVAVTDPEGDSVTVAVDWLHDDVVVPEAGRDVVLDGTWTALGGRWTCRVLATDAYGASTQASASAMAPVALIVPVGESVTLGVAGSTESYAFTDLVVHGTLVVLGSVRIDADRFELTGLVDGRDGGAGPCTFDVRVTSWSGSGGCGGAGRGGTGAGSLPVRTTSAAGGWGQTSSDGAAGGAGGAALMVRAHEAWLHGVVYLDGRDGEAGAPNGGGGGGAGTLDIEACSVDVSGLSLFARGGVGGAAAYGGGRGGGGAGGRMVVTVGAPLDLSATELFLTGGTGRSPGTDGLAEVVELPDLCATP